MTDAQVTVRTLLDINALCDQRGLTDEEGLALFELAWMVRADNIRKAAMIVPGGFLAAQERQLDLLDKMLARVRAETPDLEGGRLFHDGDIEGLLRHAERRRRGKGDH
jgi:hypothetical protein